MKKLLYLSLLLIPVILSCSKNAPDIDKLQNVKVTIVGEKEFDIKSQDIKRIIKIESPKKVNEDISFNISTNSNDFVKLREEKIILKKGTDNAYTQITFLSSKFNSEKDNRTISTTISSDNKNIKIDNSNNDFKITYKNDLPDNTDYILELSKGEDITVGVTDVKKTIKITTSKAVDRDIYINFEVSDKKFAKIYKESLIMEKGKKEASLDIFFTTDKYTDENIKKTIDIKFSTTDDNAKFKESKITFNVKGEKYIGEIVKLSNIAENYKICNLNEDGIATIVFTLEKAIKTDTKIEFAFQQVPDFVDPTCAGIKWIDGYPANIPAGKTTLKYKIKVEKGLFGLLPLKLTCKNKMVELTEKTVEFKFAKSLNSIISITQNISEINTKNSDITADINVFIDEPAKKATTINFKVESSNELATGVLSSNSVTIPIGEKSTTTKINFSSYDFYNLKDIVYVNVLASADNDIYIEPTKNNCEFKVTGHNYIPDSEKQQLDCYLDFELDNIYFIEGVEEFSKEFYISSSKDVTKDAKINLNISGLDDSDYSLYIEREPLTKPEITLNSENKYIAVEIKIKKSAIDKILKIRISSEDATIIKKEAYKEIPVSYYKTPEKPIDYKIYYDIEGKTEVNVKNSGWMKLKFHTTDKVDIEYPVSIELDESSIQDFDISVGKIIINAKNSEKMIYIKIKNFSSLKNGDNTIIKFKSKYSTFKDNAGIKLKIVK